jgi:chemotaxis protein methyltransferase CheR
MNREALDHFYALLRSKVGILLDEKKDYLIQSRLQPLARNYQFESVEAFIEDLLAQPLGERHWESFVALTTNETSFFRDRHFFEGIRDHVLPKLIAERAATKTLNIWSAAASTGQEAYSISLLIRESFPELARWKINIVATDISPLNISRAEAGVYSHAETERGLDAHYRNRHFTKHGDGRYEVSKAIRDMVSFSTMNLIEPWPRLPKFDLILLRNVMIYFGQDTKDRLLDQMHASLAPGGILVLGATETIYANPRFGIQRYEKFSCYSPRSAS